MSQPTTTPPDGDPRPRLPDDAERRAALAKLGALAAWTAPTLLTLLASRRASAASFLCPPGTDPDGKGGCR